MSHHADTTPAPAEEEPGRRNQDLPPAELDDRRDRIELRDRYYGLLQELRVVLPGVQVLVAFLLTVPFSQRFEELDRVGRIAFFVALISAVLATVCFVSPAATHRAGGRTRRVARLTWAVRLTSAGLVLLAVALCAAVYCVSRFVFDDTVAIVLGGVVLVAILGLWAVLPRSMTHSRHEDPPAAGQQRELADLVERPPE